MDVLIDVTVKRASVSLLASVLIVLEGLGGVDTARVALKSLANVAGE